MIPEWRFGAMPQRREQSVSKGLRELGCDLKDFLNIYIHSIYSIYYPSFLKKKERKKKEKERKTPHTQHIINLLVYN